MGILNFFTKSFAIFLRLLVKHNALELQFFPSKQFFRNVEEFGAKEYFTDHQTANTIQLFVAITGSFFWSILLLNKLQRRGIPSWVVDKCSHLFSKKYMDYMTQPLSSAAINFFFTGNQQILLYQEMQIYIAFWNIISNFFTLFESLKIVLINMVTILMISAKMANPGLLKIKVLWNIGYGVIIYFRDVTNKLFSGESIYIVDVVMWPKFGNSSISTSNRMASSAINDKFDEW